MFANGKLVENIKVVLSDVVLLNTAGLAGDYVSLKNYGRCAIVFALAPASGTDASAVTVKQCKTVDNSPVTEKALAFTQAYKCGAPGTSDALVVFDVTAGTFNTSAAAAKEVFVIEVDGRDLDIDNGFDCIRLAMSDPGSVSTPCAAMYLLYNAKYKAATPPSAIVD